MSVKKSNLSWIVVSDINKARDFYTKILGLNEEEFTEQFGWSELKGNEGGARIGLAQSHKDNNLEAGGNAIITLTVEDLSSTLSNFKENGVTLIGDVMEIPGHVKMQMFQDPDGNKLQLVEML